MQTAISEKMIYFNIVWKAPHSNISVYQILKSQILLTEDS